MKGQAGQWREEWALVVRWATVLQDLARCRRSPGQVKYHYCGEEEYGQSEYYYGAIDAYYGAIDAYHNTYFGICHAMEWPAWMRGWSP